MIQIMTIKQNTGTLPSMPAQSTKSANAIGKQFVFVLVHKAFPLNTKLGLARWNKQLNIPDRKSTVIQGVKFLFF